MRRSISILLLITILFNVAGYRLFVAYLQHLADVRMEDEISNVQLSDERLLTAEIPINLPYTPQRTDYENAQGEIEINGKIYRYAKWKIENGKMILHYLENNEKSRIKAAAEDYLAKLLSVVTQKGKKSALREIKTDFFQTSTILALSIFAKTTGDAYPAVSSNSTSRGYLSLLTDPPEAA